MTKQDTFANMVKTINNGNQQEYQWDDDLGYHQYYCDEINIPTDSNTIQNYKCEEIKEGFIYSWNDNLGFHQYYYTIDSSNLLEDTKII